MYIPACCLRARESATGCSSGNQKPARSCQLPVFASQGIPVISRQRMRSKTPMSASTPHLGPTTSNLEPRTSNFELQTSNLDLQTSNFKLRTSNFAVRSKKPETGNQKPAHLVSV